MGDISRWATVVPCVRATGLVKGRDVARLERVEKVLWGWRERGLRALKGREGSWAEGAVGIDVGGILAGDMEGGMGSGVGCNNNQGDLESDVESEIGVGVEGGVENGMASNVVGGLVSNSEGAVESR